MDVSMTKEEWPGTAAVCCAADLRPYYAKGYDAGHMIAQSARQVRRSLCNVPVMVGLARDRRSWYHCWQLGGLHGKSRIRTSSHFNFALGAVSRGQRPAL